MKHFPYANFTQLLKIIQFMLIALHFPTLSVGKNATDTKKRHSGASFYTTNPHRNYAVSNSEIIVNIIFLITPRILFLLIPIVL